MISILEEVFAEQQQQQNSQQQQQQQDHQQQQQPEDGSTSSWSGFFQQLLSSNPEVAGIVSTLERYIPFILILATKQLFDYSTGTKDISFIFSFIS